MQTPPDEILREIRDYIAQAFFVDFDKGATVQTDLFESDHLDSFGFVELITYVEQKYSIKLTEDDLIAPSIGSVAGMHEIVMKRLSEAKAG